ncbi:MAG: YtpR family tRNA-binding protein, partial [Woeseiaceae bacterium]
MRISERWLREWVDPPLDTEALARCLTMAGHEVEAVHPEGTELEGVVVAEVLAVASHPDADRLSVCRVSIGNGDAVDVVCGAPNVRAGMKSPFAGPGTRLPNGLELRRTKIRGVVSNGMLCSAIELALGEESGGILELPAAARPGTPLAELLGFPDAVLDINLTPNRGDCFSVRGLARDLAAASGQPLANAIAPSVKQRIRERHEVVVETAAACPRFAGRVIRGIDAHASSPLWMTERLRRSGIRGIHPVVDVTNYVMLELGQP